MGTENPVPLTPLGQKILPARSLAWYNLGADLRMMHRNTLARKALAR